MVPGPTAIILPLWGFSLAESGIIIPEDVLVSANYGNFVNVRELSGPWDVSGHDRVELYDKVQHSVSNNSLGTTGREGNKIGEARVRGLEHSSGTRGTQNALYKMYL